MSKRVEIYTTPFCPFCHMAKGLLTKKGVTFEEIDVMSQPKLRQEMTAKAGAHTVPQIFVDGDHIGDCDGIHALDSQGRLDGLLGLS